MPPIRITPSYRLLSARPTTSEPRSKSPRSRSCRNKLKLVSYRKQLRHLIGRKRSLSAKSKIPSPKTKSLNSSLKLRRTLLIRGSWTGLTSTKLKKSKNFWSNRSPSKSLTSSWPTSSWRRKKSSINCWTLRSLKTRRNVFLSFS